MTGAGGVATDNPADTSAELRQEIHRYNVRGTERLARLAAAAGVRRFVFCSSLRIFGFRSQVDWREDDPRSPADVYADAKAMAETALLDLLYGVAAAVEVAGRWSGWPAPLSRAQLSWYLNDHNFSIGRARDELGYRPRYRLADGLAEIDLRQFGVPA